MSGKCTKCGADKCGLSYCKICEVKPEKENKVYQLRPMSSKKQKANKKKLATYGKIEQKGRGAFCESCGTTSKPLSRSHILPVGMYPLFEAVEENIVIDCYGDSESCHWLWEHGTWEQKKKLNNFDHRVEVILKLAPSFLEQITPIKQTV